MRKLAAMPKYDPDLPDCIDCSHCKSQEGKIYCKKGVWVNEAANEVVYKRGLEAFGRGGKRQRRWGNRCSFFE